jgi:RND superfamily putative drug exporter
VISPFTAAGAKQVSADRRTASATVVFTSDSHEAAAAKLAAAAATSRLNVQVGGAAFTEISPGGASEVIGILAALLLGLVILNAGFLTGMGIAAAVTVFLTVMAAVTLLPALLAVMGRRVLRKSERATAGPRASASVAAAPDEVPGRPGGWARWGRLVERRPVGSVVLALVVLAGLAAPALAIRLGSADASSAPAGTSARSFNDTMADAFGKGFDAPLLLVAKTPDRQARAAWSSLTRELPGVKGIAAVGTPAAVSGDSLSTVQVVPATAAQDQATSDLVGTLRSGIVPRAEAGTGLRVYVGVAVAVLADAFLLRISPTPNSEMVRTPARPNAANTSRLQGAGASPHAPDRLCAWV